MVCVCPLHRGISSLVSHVTRWSSLLGQVRSGDSPSLLNMQLIGSPHTHPCTAASYLAMGCVTLTHSHCYSLAVTALCLPGRLSAPRAVLLMIPNLFDFQQRCQPALTCMIRTILHFHLQMSRTMDGTSRQYKHKQHCYITFLYCHQHCEHRSTFVK